MTGTIRHLPYNRHPTPSPCLRNGPLYQLIELLRPAHEPQLLGLLSCLPWIESPVTIHPPGASQRPWRAVRRGNDGPHRRDGHAAAPCSNPDRPPHCAVPRFLPAPQLKPSNAAAPLYPASPPPNSTPVFSVHGAANYHHGHSHQYPNPSAPITVFTTQEIVTPLLPTRAPGTACEPFPNQSTPALLANSSASVTEMPVTSSPPRPANAPNSTFTASTAPNWPSSPRSATSNHPLPGTA